MASFVSCSSAALISVAEAMHYADLEALHAAIGDFVIRLSRPAELTRQYRGRRALRVSPPRLTRK